MTPDANSQLTSLETLRQEALDELERMNKTPAGIKNQQDLEAHERQILAISHRIADLTTAIAVQKQIDDREFRKEGKDFLRSCGSKHVCKGIRLVSVRFAGGTEIVLAASYWGRKHFSGKREKGLFPELYLLGIHQKCTPLLASQIALASTSLGSFEEAQHMLADRGCKLDIKTIIRVTKQLATYARMGHQGLPLSSQENSAARDNLAGRTVVIATDGGRLRIRKNKRGPKTKKKRNRYSTAWREPKLLIIYVSQPDGRLDKSFLPLIDGTLDGPDAMFALLYRHLLLLNIGNADQVLFIADGARWIWERVHLIKHLLGASGASFNPIELIDFYHAAQHLYEFAGLKRGWSKKKRKRWVNSQKKALKAGKIVEVIRALKEAAKGSKSKILRREVQYFVKNRSRFAYDRAKALGLPIGSGAIESAIRRVVNLRLKSPCLYWNENTAMSMLLLRSYYKSGRWNDIKTLAYLGGLKHAA